MTAVKERRALLYSSLGQCRGRRAELVNRLKGALAPVITLPLDCPLALLLRNPLGLQQQQQEQSDCLSLENSSCFPP